MNRFAKAVDQLLVWFILFQMITLTGVVIFAVLAIVRFELVAFRQELVRIYAAVLSGHRLGERGSPPGRTKPMSGGQVLCCVARPRRSQGGAQKLRVLRSRGLTYLWAVWNQISGLAWAADTAVVE